LHYFPGHVKGRGSYILPENVPANEFLNLESDKISTSRNWAVWLHEYLEEFKDKQDVLRYTLTANMPETKDNDFTWKDFQGRNNSELVAILGNFVNRTLVLTHKYFEGKMPGKKRLTDEDKAVLAQIPVLKENVEKSIENFRFREALKEAMNLARLGNKYLADTEPWQVYKTDPERVEAILAVSLDITAALTIIMEPFLPFSCEKMRKFLNIDKLDWELLNGDEFLTEGHQLNETGLLFEKIEDAQVEFQVNKLLKTKQENENGNYC
jgi:methionyl-tRNA synthetase